MMNCNTKHRRGRSVLLPALVMLSYISLTTATTPATAALTLLPFYLLSSSTFHVVTAERPNIKTHEDVIASREKRRRQLEKVLENAKKKLEEDRTGVKQLSEQAKAQFEKKIPVYEHQLQELGRELDQEEVDRILENSRKHRERLMGDEL